jgi:hypothetical protein
MPVQSQIAEETLRALLAEGLKPAEIARRLGVADTTVTRRMRRLGLEAAQQATVPVGVRDLLGVHNGTRAGIPGGTPEVRTGVPPELLTDLLELVQWWRGRKVALRAGPAAGTKTQRITYHVEARWIAAIKQAADLEHVSITEIVNRAFHAYFHDAAGGSCADPDVVPPPA